MTSPTRIFSALMVLAIALAMFTTIALGQSTTKTKPSSGVITGHVTVDDKPVADVTVVLFACENGLNPTEPPSKSTTTDGEGLYRLSSVPAGHYCVDAFSPAWFFPLGIFQRDLHLADGETVDGIDLALKKGGVITGRVTYADGEPVIAESVSARQIGDNGVVTLSKSDNTDDRGVYRIFGLPPGEYTIQVGQADSDGGAAGGGRRFHPLTYHADEQGETDSKKARKVTVKSDDEATDIDITVRPLRTYAVSGTVVNEQTGLPVANVKIVCGIQSADGRQIRVISPFQYTANGNGEFSFPNLSPGHYVIMMGETEGISLYSDPLSFEVQDSGVSGLILKAKPAGGLTGVIIINGGVDSDLTARTSRLHVNLFSSSPDRKTSSVLSANIEADGTFHFDGVRPGYATLSLGSSNPDPGFKLIRVERGGADVKGGIQVQPGEAISDVRLVLGYGTGTVRGTVRIEGGTLPLGTRVRVAALPSNRSQGPTLSAFPDARGQFVIQNVIPGRYILQTGTPRGSGSPPSNVQIIEGSQNVDITDGGDVSVTLTIIVKSPSRDGNQ